MKGPPSVEATLFHARRMVALGARLSALGVGPTFLGAEPPSLGAEPTEIIPSNKTNYKAHTYNQ